MKVAICQINTATTDMEGNLVKILSNCKRAKEQGADVCVFPELSIIGYPPKDDLFLQDRFELQQQCIEKIQQACLGMHVIVGVVEKSKEHFYNSALWIDRNGDRAYQRKELIPHRDVFDEKRYFESGNHQSVWMIDGIKIGVSVCEDLWAPFFQNYHTNPIQKLAEEKPAIMINISASPFVAGKDEIRKNLIQTHLKQHACDFIYVNLVGGNDELVFDGGSFVMNQTGELVAQAKSFEEDLLFWDSKTSHHTICAYPQDILEQKRKAIVLGLKDFVYKNSFRNVVVGLSGGIDSALVSMLAVEAFGNKQVVTVFMPTEFTSPMSDEDATTIASNLNIPLLTLPMNELKNNTAALLEKHVDASLESLTKENLQARLRGMLLMAVSMEKNALVLQTGNKTEIALGYCTLYGDMAGAISPIGDLYKHEVYAMTKKLNDTYHAIPNRVFERAPSAELSKDQKDSDSLPPYDVADEVVRYIVEEEKSLKEIVQLGFSVDVVKKLQTMIHTYEFKRKQAPPVLKLTKKSFGVGRKMPIAKRNYEN
ncbi:MAG: NAD+ synthase [Bdellovibrionales bacterium]|nr:NAD+ synthase [Bdellovibrionales bacterium]